ncbi:hypothetical protein [Sphingobium sp. B8D3C]|uniref:hypothetical protein n=2 Tax=unclassified Sphingobium TaxID=2611147 RepID=UPI0022255329|nr:hypothetical protein [Sphingobium sp. B8D3C]MCW2395789.1 hypothetical protein [Sphingobium sp. B8D3B]MCW2419304.1 hypothetical protein [Sphingobium sp. B8D3C]
MMRKLLPLLACLMLVLSGFAGMAHAAEAVGGSVLGAELTVHAPGDGDEVPADSDNGLPHHHNPCHGHHVGTPATIIGSQASLVTNDPEQRHLRAPLPDGRGGVLPRPPQA